ncbi:hypothetical protein N6L27_19890 [Leisingera sp. SS27]|uniref:hypothetical protein n=1 Tax=Leisingera sp. SS27 TaxID=2979462 RepID=UPI00232E5CDA|nr:hypothetical protein [Leisingera sp. SS27]MDC0660271.1 hypothetical protein [Leisingera sp. SS27]
MAQGSGEEQAGTRTERQTYRRRRLMDISRLLPLIGALLLALPLLWPEASAHPAARGGVSMSSAIIYVFSVWIALIAACFVFSLAVQRWADHWTGGGADGGSAASRPSGRPEDS